MRLLEWSGLYLPLQAVLDDLENVVEEDRLLLLGSLHSARIKVHMPAIIAAKAVNNVRLCSLLAIWLHRMRCLTGDPQAEGDSGLTCCLSIIDDKGEAMSLNKSSTSPTTSCVAMHAQVLDIEGIDGQRPFKVTIGNPHARRNTHRHTVNFEPERGNIMSVPEDKDGHSMTSVGNPPSLTSSMTAGSPSTCRTPSTFTQEFPNSKIQS